MRLWIRVQVANIVRTGPVGVTGIHTCTVLRVAHHRAWRGSNIRSESWLSVTMYEDVV